MNLLGARPFSNIEILMELGDGDYKICMLYLVLEGATITEQIDRMTSEAKGDVQ